MQRTITHPIVNVAVRGVTVAWRKLKFFTGTSLPIHQLLILHIEIQTFISSHKNDSTYLCSNRDNLQLVRYNISLV